MVRRKRIWYLATGVLLVMITYYPSFILHQISWYETRRPKIPFPQNNFKDYAHNEENSIKSFRKTLLFHVDSPPFEFVSINRSRSNTHFAKPNRKWRFNRTKLLPARHQVRQHPELCPNKFVKYQGISSGVKLLVAVTSAAGNMDARSAVRLTWGHYSLRRDVVLVFMLGQPDPSNIDNLMQEDMLYNDLVQLDNTEESYAKDSLKTVFLLKWINEYCPDAQFVLKTNDDVFINMPKLIEFINEPENIRASRTIWGHTHHEPKSRDCNDCLSGAAYLMTLDSVRPLHDAAVEMPHTECEDDFITGIAADNAAVTRVHVNEFFKQNITENTCEGIRRGIAYDKVLYHQQFYLWKIIHYKKANCDFIMKDEENLNNNNFENHTGNNFERVMF